MSAANKAKGSRFESDIEQHLNSNGLRARRLPRSGAKDIGDVAVELKKLTLVLEAKNVKTPQMADFLRQASVEADNYEAKYDVATLGVVVCKTRQKGTGEARVTLTLDALIDLLHWTGAA